MGTIYIKSNLGITHFAHKYMENLTCSLQTKAFKNFNSEWDLIDVKYIIFNCNLIILTFRKDGIIHVFFHFIKFPFP